MRAQAWTGEDATRASGSRSNAEHRERAPCSTARTQPSPHAPSGDPLPDPIRPDFYHPPPRSDHYTSTVEWGAPGKKTPSKTPESLPWYQFDFTGGYAYPSRSSQKMYLNLEFARSPNLSRADIGRTMHRLAVMGDVLEEDSRALIQYFFSWTTCCRNPGSGSTSLKPSFRLFTTLSRGFSRRASAADD